MNRCGGESEKSRLAISHFVKLDYETLVELIASASQAEGYLHTMDGYPNAKDISARLHAALEKVTK